MNISRLWLMIFSFFTVFGLFLPSLALAASDTLDVYNNCSIPIPDNTGASVNATVTTSNAPSGAIITGVRVYSEVYHTYRGNLNIWITAYYNNTWHDYFLLERPFNKIGNDSSDNYLGWTSTIHQWDGASPNQTWYLCVKDFASGDTGVLEFFQIQVDWTNSGNISVDVKNSSGSRLGASEMNAVILFSSGGTENDRITSPSSNPMTFSDKLFGSYFVDVYCWDMLATRTSTFSHNSPTMTIYPQTNPKRPLKTTVYYTGGSVPYAGASVYLDSWNGQSSSWTQRASGTTDSNGTYTFSAWPTTISGEKYRIRVKNSSSTQVGIQDPVTRPNDTSTVNYPITTTQAVPTGTISVTVKDSDGTNLSISEMNAVILFDRRLPDGSNEIQRKQPPTANPVNFTTVPWGPTYFVDVYCWDMLAGRSSDFSHMASTTNQSLQTNPKRPLKTTVYYTGGSVPYAGASVYLDSWNGQSSSWTQRASGTTDSNGTYTFSAWPTTISGEKYRIRVKNSSSTQVGIQDPVTRPNDTSTVNYPITTTQAVPTISGIITGITFNTDTIATGSKTIEATILISNRGCTEYTFYVGASSIMNGGTTWHNWMPDRASIRIAQGASAPVKLRWSPSLDVESGTYGFYCKLFDHITEISSFDEEWRDSALHIISNPYPCNVRANEIIVVNTATVAGGGLTPSGDKTIAQELIDRCLAYGVPAICLSIQSEQGQLFFNPDPVIPYTQIYQSWPNDNLINFINSAHDNGLKVYATMPIFSDPVLYNSGDQFKMYTLKNGTRVPQLNWISPMVDAVRDHRIQIINAAMALGFDGIRTDFCRYEDVWNDATIYASSPSPVDPFTIIQDPHPHPEDETWYQWIDWRANAISNFNDSVKNLVQGSVGAYTYINSAMVGAYRNPDAAGLPYSSWTGQRYEDFGTIGNKNGGVHAIPMPMLYWQGNTMDQCRPFCEVCTDIPSSIDWVNTGLKCAKQLAYPTEVIPVLSVSDESCKLGKLSSSEMTNIMQELGIVCRSNGIKEISYFSYGQWDIAKFEYVQASYVGPVPAIPQGFLDFGEVAISSPSSKIFVLKNIGTETLNVNVSSTNGSFNIQGTNISLPAGGSANVTVVFTPTSITNYQGSILFEGDDFNYSRKVYGNGVSNIIPPIVAPISDHTAIEHETYHGPTPALSQGTLPVTWSIVTAPSEMTISSSTGVVTWINPITHGTSYQITIRATNSAGYDNETWYLTVNEATPVYYTLSLDKSGNGEVFVNNNIETLPWSESFIAGTNIYLEAIPDDGCLFNHWSGTVTTNDNPTSIILDNNHNILAEFVEFKLTDPNGAEHVLANKYYLVQWNVDPVVADVKIEYSVNNGVDWLPVSPQNTGNSGQYEWLVPDVTSDQCLVRISDASNSLLYDISDAPFKIYPCRIPDLTGDCVIDLEDLNLMVSEWLTSGYRPLIPQGMVTVDGDISDWTDAVWRPLDIVYWGSPSDVPSARFALKWNDVAQKVYVVVEVTDSDHVFSDSYVSWDASDRLEIYCQGNPVGESSWMGIYNTAQQYYVAPGTADNSWAAWAFGQAIALDVGLEYATQVSGDTITYEAAVSVFENYGGFNDTPTMVKTLTRGTEIGFDVVVCTRHAAGFGMLSANELRYKSNDASKFAKYRLN